MCSCGTSLSYSSPREDSHSISSMDEGELEKELAKRYLNDAKHLTAQGKHLEAMEYFDKSLNLDYSRDALRLKGKAYFDAGNYQMALETLRKFSRRDYKICTLTGDVLVKMERFYEAIEEYGDAAAYIEDTSFFNKNEILADIYEKIGWTYNLMANYEMAVKYFEKAIFLDEDMPKYWNSKAVALDNWGKHVDALKFYDIALELGGDDVIANNRRNCLRDYARKYREGTYKMQSKYLKEALALDDNG